MSRQIDSITNIDRMDTFDRAKLKPEVKLCLLCDEAREATDRDPRGGGHALVMRPRVALQLLIDFNVKSTFVSDSTSLLLQRAMILSTSRGDDGADLVGWWRDIPLMIRSNVADDNVHVVQLEKVPPSKQVDRQRAGQIRLAAHNGMLEKLRET